MLPQLIIDTDPGIDDTMALFYALSAPEFDITGITTVFGNAPTSVCTTNALRILEIADRRDIPVAAGAQRPLTSIANAFPDFIHGSDGQGNIHLPAPQTEAADQHAVQFLIDAITNAPGEITLVTLAPLTNIAMALLIHPDLAQSIREIVMMGGNAFVPGNATPTAEANIWNDPEAADIVFAADCPITMIGLDVTEKVKMSPAQLDSIGQHYNPRTAHLGRILPFYRAFHRERYGFDGIHIHDSTTISYLLRPDLFKTVRYPICVETLGISRGKTWPALSRSDHEDAWTGRRAVNICVGLDGEAAVEMELDRLRT